MVGLLPDKVHCGMYVALPSVGHARGGTGYASHVGHSFDHTS